ncbi:hypothetical protein AB1Y20_020196 [Prymnesium parvum]|uniref:Uncharacterized protein n=1 Tax=Prymnesium parvum TaxID=97485 RepID=A0AB34JTZ0_PRYPA
MSVAVVVKCSGVELKLTLGSKHLERSLHAALIVPFLGAYNKKAPDSPVAWEDVKCVQIDGFTVYNVMDSAKSMLKADRPVVRLLTSVSGTLSSSFLQKAKEHEAELGPVAVASATKSADIDEHPPDDDLSRRCAKAFDSIRGNADLVSRKEVIVSFLSKAAKYGHLRQLSFIEFSQLVKPIDYVLHTMETSEDKDVDFEEFARFFSAISAAALAPVSELPRPAFSDDIPADGILGELLNTPGAAVRRLA